MIINDLTFVYPPRMPGMRDEQYSEHCKILDRSRKPTPERVARWKAEDDAVRAAFTNAVAAENAKLSAGHIIDPNPPLSDNGVVVVSRAGAHWQAVYRLTGGTWANLHAGQGIIPDQKAMLDGWDYAFRRALDFVIVNAEIDPDDYERALDCGSPLVLCREGLKAVPDRWCGAGYFMEASRDGVVREHIDKIIKQGRSAEHLWVRLGVTVFDICEPKDLSVIQRQALDRYYAECSASEAAA